MLVRESLEEKIPNAIDYKKLAAYANAIGVMCDGEYGDVFYDEAQNHVWICLGDSNPFDESMLIEYIKGAIRKGDYSSEKHIKITVEDECYPQGSNWKKIKS